jgi:iodothyronine deiodinase-like protein
VPALNKLYQQYRDRVAFYIVYIQEAHPVDAWQLYDNVKDDVLVATTTTKDERFNAAGLCVRNLGVELPAVIDDPDNHVERAYTGWPDRLYVIDRDGAIAHKSKAGPFGFKPAEVEDRLRQLAPVQSSVASRQSSVASLCPEPET